MLRVAKKKKKIENSRKTNYNVMCLVTTTKCFYVNIESPCTELNLMC